MVRARGALARARRGGGRGRWRFDPGGVFELSAVRRAGAAAFWAWSTCCDRRSGGWGRARSCWASAAMLYRQGLRDGASSAFWCAFAVAVRRASGEEPGAGAREGRRRRPGDGGIAGGDASGAGGARGRGVRGAGPGWGAGLHRRAGAGGGVRRGRGVDRRGPPPLPRAAARVRDGAGARRELAQAAGPPGAVDDRRPRLERRAGGRPAGRGGGPGDLPGPADARLGEPRGAGAGRRDARRLRAGEHDERAGAVVGQREASERRGRRPRPDRSARLARGLHAVPGARGGRDERLPVPRRRGALCRPMAAGSEGRDAVRQGPGAGAAGRRRGDPDVRGRRRGAGGPRGGDPAAPPSGAGRFRARRWGWGSGARWRRAGWGGR